LALVLGLLCLACGVVQVGEAQEQSALGFLTFAIAPGPSSKCPADVSTGSWLKIRGNPSGGLVGTICNGTQGDFTAGPLILMGGVPNAQGMAPLTVHAPVVVGAHLTSQTPDCGDVCVTCWRFEQDPDQQGWVDCDGGSNADAWLVMDRHLSAPSSSCGQLVVSHGPNASGPGAAIIRVIARRLRLNSTAVCPDVHDTRWQAPDVALCPAAMVTGQATSTLQHPQRCAGNLLGTKCPNENPYQVVLRGANFDCARWQSHTSAQLVIAFQTLGAKIGSVFKVGDIVQVLRLAQQMPAATGSSTAPAPAR